MKARCIEVVQEFVRGFQERLSKVTMDDVRHYMDATRKFTYMDAFPAPVVTETKTKKSKKDKGDKKSADSITEELENARINE